MELEHVRISLMVFNTEYCSTGIRHFFHWSKESCHPLKKAAFKILPSAQRKCACGDAGGRARNFKQGCPPKLSPSYYCNQIEVQCYLRGLDGHPRFCGGRRRTSRCSPLTSNDCDAQIRAPAVHQLWSGQLVVGISFHFPFKEGCRRRSLNANSWDVRVLRKICKRNYFPSSKGDKFQVAIFIEARSGCSPHFEISRTIIIPPINNRAKAHCWTTYSL